MPAIYVHGSSSYGSGASFDRDQYTGSGAGAGYEPRSFGMIPAAVMVYVDFDADMENRVGFAAAITAQFKAALIGVAGWPLRNHDALKLSEIEFPATGEISQDRVIERLEYLGTRFRQAAGAAPKSVEWRSSLHFPREFIVEQARAADLIVIGREALPGDVYRTYDAGSVVLASGRPVLVVAPGNYHPDLSSILVAWKNTREARRAVHDSLPFLKAAKAVHIVAVCGEDDEKAIQAEVADVADYLKRHGISAANPEIARANGRDESKVLLGVVREHQADLVVAGAYGRTRLSEWIFGGVTTGLLQNSPIPCLFSN
jgi:nucleotide-binding universal stress UspA family protein